MRCRRGPPPQPSANPPRPAPPSPGWQQAPRRDPQPTPGAAGWTLPQWRLREKGVSGGWGSGRGCSIVGPGEATGASRARARCIGRGWSWVNNACPSQAATRSGCRGRGAVRPLPFALDIRATQRAPAQTHPWPGRLRAFQSTCPCAVEGWLSRGAVSMRRAGASRACVSIGKKILGGHRSSCPVRSSPLLGRSSER